MEMEREETEVRSLIPAAKGAAQFEGYRKKGAGEGAGTDSQS